MFKKLKEKLGVASDASDATATTADATVADTTATVAVPAKAKRVKRPAKVSVEETEQALAKKNSRMGKLVENM